MKILVTGASGFLGTNVLRHLANVHPEASIVAADLGEEQNAIERVAYCSLDVRSQADCRELLREMRPTHIVHAAAVTLTEETASANELTNAVNFDGTQKLFEAAVSAGSVERVLLVSSSGVYKQGFDGTACDEEHSLDPSTSYASAKIRAESLMAEYEERGRFPIVAARLGPVYGEFERTRASRPKVSLIQQLLEKLALGEGVHVAGTDMYRDWTHAVDVARAFDGLLFAPSLNHRIYNVSSGVSVAASNVLSIFAEHGLRVHRTAADEIADIFLIPDQGRKTLVIARLQQDTWFAPQFDIRSGIMQVITAARNQETVILRRDL